MSTRIYLIRHGETDWNRLGLLQGTTDMPLNATGRRQAESLANRLRVVPFDAAYTSPLRRARESAEAVLRGSRAVPLHVIPEMQELSYGLWQGRSVSPAGRWNPGLEWRWKHDPWRVRFPGGESLAEVSARAASALTRILAAHPGKTVLISGHGHLNRVLLIHALGWERERFWRIEQPNGSYCALDFEGGKATLRRRVPDAADRLPALSTEGEALALTTR